VWQKLKQLQAKLKALIERYGTVALVTWFAIFLSTVAFFWVLITFGVDVQATIDSIGLDIDEKYLAAGTVMLAYGCAQLTKPLRIIATLALVPRVARWNEKRVGANPEG
jgi:hypothetical protein